MGPKLKHPKEKQYKHQKQKQYRKRERENKLKTASKIVKTSQSEAAMSALRHLKATNCKKNAKLK